MASRSRRTRSSRRGPETSPASTSTKRRATIQRLKNFQRWVNKIDNHQARTQWNLIKSFTIASPLHSSWLVYWLNEILIPIDSICACVCVGDCLRYHPQIFTPHCENSLICHAEQRKLYVPFSIFMSPPSMAYANAMSVDWTLTIASLCSLSLILRSVAWRWESWWLCWWCGRAR